MARIEAIVAEAERTPGLSPGDEDAFALRETATRYLPETLRAFRDVPTSLRNAPDANGKTPAERLDEQLELLERAAAQRLARVAETARTDFETNGRFLAERFGPLASLPEAPAFAQAPLDRAEDARALARRVFAGVSLDERAGGAALLATIAERLGRVLPGLVRTRRAGLFDKRVAGLSVEVPSGNAQVRYTLDLDRGGYIVAGCGRVSGGVALRSERVDLETWTQALLEHVAMYAETNRAAHTALAAFLK